MDGAERSGGGAVAAFGPTSEQVREEAAEAERRAKESGTPAEERQGDRHTAASVE